MKTSKLSTIDASSSSLSAGAEARRRAADGVVERRRRCPEVLLDVLDQPAEAVGVEGPEEVVDGGQGLVGLDRDDRRG